MTSWSRRVTPERIAVALLIVAGIVLLLLVTNHGPGMCNDASRLATADSLVHHSTFVIDKSYFSYTCDKIKIGQHFFSDKPPLQSLYLALVLGGVQSVTHWTVAHDLGSIYFVVSLLSSGLAFLLTLLGVYRLSRLAGLEIAWSMLVAASACAATLMLPYSAVISSHAAGAPFLVWLFVLVFAQRRHGIPMGWARAIGMGLVAGFGAAVEPLSVAFSAPLLVAAVSFADSRRKLGWVVLGGAVPLVFHMALVHHISDNLLLANIHPDNFRYAGSMHSKQNLSGVGWAHHSLRGFLVYAFHSLIGYRGALLYNPPAALGAGSALTMALGAAGSDRDRRLFVAVCVGILLFFLLTLGFSNNYSGWSYGVRWQATPAPLVAAMTGIFMARARGRAHRLLAVALVATTSAGAVVAWLGTLEPWTPSTNREFSFVEVISAKPIYVRALLDRGYALARIGRYAAARDMAGQALRRSPSTAGAWALSIRASIALGDAARVRHYRRRLERGGLGLPSGFRYAALARIDAYLARHGRK